MTKTLATLWCNSNHALTLEFKLQDLWVGAFWKTSQSNGIETFDLWICLLPCLPLHYLCIKVGATPPPAPQPLSYEQRLYTVEAQMNRMELDDDGP